MRKLLSSPYVVMAVVLAMYVAKVIAKLSIGATVHSPMITGDGLHNAADIFEGCVVIATIWFSRLPSSETYPLGRKNIESLFSVVVGVFLIGMAVKIAGESALALIGVLEEASQDDLLGECRVLARKRANLHALMMSTHLAPWVMGVTGGSAILSLFVSRYQIKVGKTSGHEALVADGQETASDGRIELATFTGVCGQYLFAAPWIEYPIALVVAYLMVRTGREIAGRGLGALLQRSIGSDHEEAIKEIVGRMYGVEGVEQIKTFRTGGKVVLILKIATLAAPSVTRLMKEAMAQHIAPYLRGEGFEDADFFIRFDPPPSDFHRRAVFLAYEAGTPRVAPSIHEASHVVICDVEHGRVTRATEHLLDDVRRAGTTVFGLLETKRVDKVVYYAPGRRLEAEMVGPRRRIEVINGPSADPSVYGL